MLRRSDQDFPEAPKKSDLRLDIGEEGATVDRALGKILGQLGMLCCDCCDGAVDQRLRPCLIVQGRRPQIDPQYRKVGNDIVGRSAVDLGRIDLQARADGSLEPDCEVGRGDQRISAVLRIAAGMLLLVVFLYLWLNGYLV